MVEATLQSQLERALKDTMGWKPSQLGRTLVVHPIIHLQKEKQSKVRIYAIHIECKKIVRFLFPNFMASFEGYACVK